MSVVIGWDIGGAHLKAARVKDGRVEAVVHAATPLWLGLDSLESAFDVLCAQLGRAERRGYRRQIPSCPVQAKAASPPEPPLRRDRPLRAPLSNARPRYPTR